MKIEQLFTPLKIGTCEIPNRLIMAPMVVNMNPGDGCATDQFIRYYEERAKGGWGLIITEDYRISMHAGGYPHISGLFNEEQVVSHKKLTETIHKYNSKIFCQIYHAGRQANRHVNYGMQPVSCSPIPCPWNKDIPRELTIDETQEIIADYGKTAANVVKAGFDGVEIHAAHGYLIHQFLSPNSNKRTDEYGGSFENRVRFLKEVMASVRKAVGADFPMQVRLSGAEYADGGRTMFETHEIIRRIEEYGADALHLTFGMYGTRSSLGSVSSFYQSAGWNVPLAEEAKKLVKIPVITVGRIQEPYMAEEIVATGKADFVAMARQALCDAYYPEKIKAGAHNEIRHCVGCLQGCTASTYQGVPIYCLVNPELGYEYKTDYSKALRPKKIYIAGGGPAGMEAARAAAIKGHEVHLFEETDHLGGQFIAASYPPYKGEFATYPAWLIRQLKKLGVIIHMKTALTADVVKADKPDKVIIATGAKPITPDIPGISDPKVIHAEDVLRGKVDHGMNCLVIGAGITGTETAAYLAVQCKESVTLVSRRPYIGKGMEGGMRDDLHDILNRYFVNIITNTAFVAVTPEGAKLKSGDKEYIYPCDTVILGIGARSYKPLEEELKGICETVVIGDALEARQALQATREGFVAGIDA